MGGELAGRSARLKAGWMERRSAAQRVDYWALSWAVLMALLTAATTAG
jgi:hypothetical protein